jgi:hypothetical protein
MAKQKKSNEQGGKTEIVSVRLDPRLRYLAELGARIHRRALSNFIEWAIEESLKEVSLFDLPEEAAPKSSITSMSNYYWDIHEADRFARFASQHPDLLVLPEEQILARLIEKSDFIWGKPDEQADDVEKDSWATGVKHLNYERLREHWDKFKAVAKGEAKLSTLPGWSYAKHRGDT